MIRRVFLVILAIYGVWYLATPGYWGLLDGVDLAIHETGHLVFAPFGEFISVLGGTLMQLLMPLVFAIYFWRQRDGYAASIAIWWIAQNLWNIAVYVADARTEELPLVGGGEHDWAYLLGELGWLARDRQLARDIRVLGAFLFVWALVTGFRATQAAPAEQSPA